VRLISHTGLQLWMPCLGGDSNVAGCARRKTLLAGALLELALSRGFLGAPFRVVPLF